MRAPEFWTASPPTGLKAALLKFLGWPYDLATRTRLNTKAPADPGMPVICVGNFTAGGSGKTPTAIALGKLVQSLGHRPIFLSKGYGGHLKGPILVDPKQHLATDVGDEPLLLSRVATTIVARDRLEGAAMAGDIDGDVIIMDDGLQDPTLLKTLAIAVVDGETGTGNGMVIPAGPLRATLAFQLGLADAIVVVGDGRGADEMSSLARNHDAQLLRGNFRTAIDAPRLRNKKIVAYAGIGRPKKFFTTLEKAGGKLAATFSFADHHQYSAKDAEILLAAADTHDALLLTTEKDLIRLEGDPALVALREKSLVWPILFRFSDQKAIETIITRVLR